MGGRLPVPASMRLKRGRRKSASRLTQLFDFGAGRTVAVATIGMPAAPASAVALANNLVVRSGDAATAAAETAAHADRTMAAAEAAVQLSPRESAAGWQTGERRERSQGEKGLARVWDPFEFEAGRPTSPDTVAPWRLRRRGPGNSAREGRIPCFWPKVELRSSSTKRR